MDQQSWWDNVFQRRRGLLVFLCCAFLFRLAFGLCSEFWYDDELQIYLLGLKFYSTGAWPYFGPDITYQVQLPGALQGLLVALPIFALRIPEAPSILLNTLSFLSLCLLAWYCSIRLPKVPKWFIWIWLMTAPWTLNYSTHVVNPSYLLPGSIAFFIGALEIYPQTTRHLISSRVANAMMGAALCWSMQLHMSWVVLVPFIIASFYFQLRKKGSALTAFGWFFFGALLTGSLLVPTFLAYGWRAGWGGTEETIRFNGANLLSIFNLTEGILARFLSFASFEVARFLGGNSIKRFAFVRAELWMIPLLVFLLVVGILQPISMIALWFKQSHQQRDWPAIKYLTLFTVLLLCGFFIFASKPPSSHTFYITFPIAMIYSLYCWDYFLSKRRWQTFAKVFLACGIIFSLGLAVYRFHHISLYVDRARPLSAILQRDYHILGERRPGARY
jgi:hypothetical protein